MPGAIPLLLLCLLVGAARSANTCYDVTQPSLAEHFTKDSALVRICQASGDVGANSTSCHEGCFQSLVQLRQSDCFGRLLASGHQCEDVLGLIFSVLAMKKVGLPGCSTHVKDICRQSASSKALPWHAILALLAAGAAACAVATYAAVYYADKHGLHRYEGSDDGDWRHRHLSSPSPSDTPTTTELQA